MDDRSGGSLPYECVCKRGRAACAESGRVTDPEQGFGNGNTAASTSPIMINLAFILLLFLVVTITFSLLGGGQSSHSVGRTFRVQSYYKKCIISKFPGLYF